MGTWKYKIQIQVYVSRLPVIVFIIVIRHHQRRRRHHHHEQHHQQHQIHIKVHILSDLVM